MNWKKRHYLLLGLVFMTIGAWAQTEELWVQNGERNIYGVLNHQKETGKKQPLAIIVHGFNGSHDWGRNYFDTFSSLG
jgi:hypothetical protein